MRDLRFAASAPRQFAHSVRINTRNPLSKGALLVLTPAAGLAARDLAQGKIFAAQGGMSMDVLDGNICWESNTASTDAIQVAITSDLAGYPITLGLVFVPGTLGTNVNLFCISNSASLAARNKLGLRIGTSTVDAYSFNNAGTAGVASSSNAPIVNKRNVAVALAASASSRAVMLNGVLGATNTTTAGPFGVTTISIGRAASTPNLDGQVGGYCFAVIWRRLLSVDEAKDFCDNPEQLLLQPTRSWLFGITPSVTYTFAVSGGYALSGAATLLRTRLQTVSGGIAFSSAAALIRIRAQLPSGSIVFSGTAPFALSNQFTFTVSGGLTFSGAAAQLRSRVFVPAGNINFSGTVTSFHVRVVSVSGQIVFSGTKPLLRTETYAPSGQITFSGSSGMTFIPFGVAAVNSVSKISIGVNRTNRLS